MFEFEELLAKILNVSDDDWDSIPDIFYEKYEMDMDSAYELVKDLLPYCMIAESPLTKKIYQGFAKDGLWLMKEQAEDL